MKFGRYLEENATPEWKRAYIDYRACKKAIKRVAARLHRVDPNVYDEGEAHTSSGDDDHGPSAKPRKSKSITSSVTRSRSGTTPNTLNPASSNRTSPDALGSRSPKLSRQPTLQSSLSRSAVKSPGYGSVNASPWRIENVSNGSGTPNSRVSPTPLAPPPLDLGEPSIPGEPSEPPPPPPLHRRVTATRGMAVNFSPVVQAIPDRRNKEVSDESAAKDDQAHEASSGESQGRLSEDTASAGYETAPLTPSEPRPRGSPKITHSPRLGFSPKFTMRSPRVQASVGVSSSSVQDAPSGRRSLRSMALPSPRIQPKTAQTFDELYDGLEGDEREFFDVLDHELDKVETFYQSREAEATRRAHELRDQLHELAEHRRVFHELYPNGLPEWEARVGRVLPGHGARLPGFATAVNALHLRNPFTHHDDDGVPSGSGSNGKAANGKAVTNNVNGSDSKAAEDAAKDRNHHVYDPESYTKYKKDLRTAALEFYRQLELIKNYRILNLTGFRKALKKFEKATKITCLEMYSDDRIALASFSHSETIDALIKQTEDLYTEHFEHGDGKRARDKLRRQERIKTHHFSTFRSGVMIGLALPAAVLAIVKSFENETRQLIPAYMGLLQVYAALFMPVIFALLFELNLDAFVEARINYEFVMELSRPTLDYRSYFEIPAFLFLTLSYCFFFSFYRVATHSVAPTTWPAAWLVFVLIFFFNPLPILRQRSRFWFLRVLWRVFTPGYSRVEFIAFFIADELNSLVYTLQSIYFMGCAYAHKWPGDIYTVCPSGASWPYALLLCIPPLVRLIQCLKRYHDSGLRIHLVNAGKYGSSILQSCLFVYWRSRGSPRKDASFVVWVMFATVMSVYTSSWDLVVDWSLLRPHHKLLRPDLGYGAPIVYYWAMASNVLIRFVWVWYIPNTAAHTRLRSWLFAVLEMLRRWQWNFFRVETEHLGNADAYRVTREIPLPYRRVEQDSEDDDMGGMSRGGGGGGGGARRKSSSNPFSIQLDRIRKSLVGASSVGRGKDALNLGPRGHAAQREYEARRPSDARSSHLSNNGEEEV